MPLSLAEFKRRVRTCGSFQRIDHENPYLSGPRTVISAGPRVIEYATGGPPKNGRTEWPAAGLYRIEDNTITWLDPDDGRDSFTYVFPFATAPGPRTVRPAEADALLIGATGVGEHEPSGATVFHGDTGRYPMTWDHVPQATLPGRPADPETLTVMPVTYHVELSLGGTTWHRTAAPAQGSSLHSGVTGARRDHARLTQDSWTSYLAYPSGLCARLTPTGLDGQLVDQALHVVIQEPGWDDPHTAMELAQRVLQIAGLR